MPVHHHHNNHHNPLLLLFTLTLTTLTLLPLSTSTLSASRSALLTLRTSLGGRTLFWNTSSPTPCTWPGVQCDSSQTTITALHLPAYSLTGTIPSNIFPSLPSLHTLSLRYNLISGPIPSDISSCTNLRNLYLHQNQFSGPIPDSISNLPNLIRLNLASNALTGQIKPSLSKLVRLKTLYLENNQFTGSLPEMKLNHLEQFNVSGNQLNGTIPVSLSSMPVSSFDGTKLCGKPLHICPGLAVGAPDMPVSVDTAGNKTHRKRGGLSGGAIAGIVIGVVVAVAIILMLIIFICGRKRQQQTSRGMEITPTKYPEIHTTEKPDPESGNMYSVPTSAVAGNGNTLTKTSPEVNVVGGGANKKLVFFGSNSPRVFDLEDLLRASAEVLGKGSFGTAYKAVLEVGAVVAVKRLKDVIVSESEFRDRMEVVGGMNHENLVQLVAYYYSRDEKLLVYDYMPMGSLSALLHGSKGAGRTPLTWQTRCTIAYGTSIGINYLHSQSPTTSHGNIKSSNILLTKTHTPKLSDFGLSTLTSPSTTPNRITSYRAPEVTDPRRVSQKADVYSFGVLLLELLTGKAPTHAVLNEEGVDLPRWVQSMAKEEWSSEVFDLELLRCDDDDDNGNAEEEMVKMLQLAIDCAAIHPDERPVMSEVVKRIEGICSVRKVMVEDFDGESVQDDNDDDITSR